MTHPYPQSTKQRAQRTKQQAEFLQKHVAALIHWNIECSSKPIQINCQNIIRKYTEKSVDIHRSLTHQLL